MTSHLRRLTKDNPERFWIEWCHTNPKSLAMARIKVSYEDTVRILQRVKKGKENIDFGNFAMEQHNLLLQRMLTKQWVLRSEIKPYEIFISCRTPRF